MKICVFKILIVCALQATLLVSLKAVSNEKLIKKMEPMVDKMVQINSVELDKCNEAAKRTAQREPKSISKLDLKINENAQKNKYIRNCLVRVPDGSDEDVSFPVDDGRGEWEAAYDLKKEDGQIILESEIYFHIKKNKAAITQQVEEVIPCMKDFFARHGIKFRPTFYYESWKSYFFKSSDHVVSLYENLPEHLPNARKWATKMTNGIPVNLSNKSGSINRCSQFLHEYSHLLGMVDDKVTCNYYGESMKQKPPITSTDAFAPPEKLRICPEQIISMLSPLCEAD